MNPNPNPDRRGTPSFLFAAAINVIILWVINAHEVWRPWLDGVVTPAFADALWAMNLNGAIQVGGNLVLAVRRPRPLREWIELAFSSTALIGAVVVYRVFPFDVSRFGGWAVTVVHLLLILGIVGAGIGLVVNVLRIAGVGGRRRPVHP